MDEQERREVLVYKHGTPGIKVWSRIERIPDVLKVVNR